VIEYIHREVRTDVTHRELSLIIGEMPGFRIVSGERVEMFLY
jgi:hypothetical protein